MFNIDIDEIDWYERMVEATLENIGDVIRIPINHCINIKSYNDLYNEEELTVKKAVYKIFHEKEHPLEYIFVFMGYEE